MADELRVMLEVGPKGNMDHAREREGKDLTGAVDPGPGTPPPLSSCFGRFGSPFAAP
jgi:hypothetical protein